MGVAVADPFAAPMAGASLTKPRQQRGGGAAGRALRTNRAFCRRRKARRYVSGPDTGRRSGRYLWSLFTSPAHPMSQPLLPANTVLVDPVTVGAEYGRLLDALASRFTVPNLGTLSMEPQLSVVSDESATYDW